MERQIEQLLKEVKGNETLERLVKMNKNPNELFIERIRAMNKGENGNENENEYKKQKKRLLDFIDNLKRYIPDEPPNNQPNDSFNDPPIGPLNDPPIGPLNDPLDDLLNEPLNDPLDDLLNEPLNDPPIETPGNQRNFHFTNSDIVEQNLKNIRDDLYQN